MSALKKLKEVDVLIAEVNKLVPFEQEDLESITLMQIAYGNAVLHSNERLSNHIRAELIETLNIIRLRGSKESLSLATGNIENQ